jgi:acetyl esterase/lipase
MNQRHPFVLAALLTLVLATGVPAAAQVQVVVQLATGPVALVPGDLIEATHLERWSAEEVGRRAAAVFGTHGPPAVTNAVDPWHLRFVTTGIDGEPDLVSAQAFTPVAPPSGPPPLLVYGAGTTGVAAVCAPSREGLLPAPLGSYRELMAPYAARGVTVVLPDYLGFDDAERPQAYFVAEAEAHVMLDAARAMVALYARAQGLGALRGDVFVGGYSQGGHAAFAAADRHADYAPEVPLRGAIGYAATTDVTELLATAAYYAPFVLLAYRSTYGPAIDPAQVLAPRFAVNLEQEAGSFCVDRAQQVYAYEGERTYTPEFHRALQARDLAPLTPALALALEQNSTGLAGHGFPALVVQGGRDVIVRDVTQERFVAALCAAGSSVRYHHVPGARHRDTRPAGFEPTLTWLWERVNGAPPPSDCRP